MSRHERAIAEWRLAAARELHDTSSRRGSDPVIRPATPQDTPRILELIAASYNRENTSQHLDYWCWKHGLNPFGASPCLVAESDGRLVGVRVFMRWTWYSENRRILAARAVDTATLPEWRGMGVFSRLTMRLVEQMQREGVSFIYNTPNVSSMPGYLKMGWTPVTRIPLWIRPLRLSALVARVFTRTADWSPEFSNLDSIAEVLNDRRLPAFLADITLRDTRYHTARTAGYLAWRYGSVPGISYRARLEIAGDAGALLIARGRVRGRFREVTISELLATPSIRGAQLAHQLLSDLAGSTDADYIAACAARGTTERQALLRSGFVPAPSLGPYLAARRLDSAVPDPAQWANWRCSIGDLELF